jgi:hypothetical protein
MLGNKKTLFERLINQENKEHHIIEEKDYRNLSIKIIIIFIGILLIGVFFTIHLGQKFHETTDYRLVSGSIWGDPPLIAEFSFPIFKGQDEYMEERRIAADNTLPVFILDETVKPATLRIINSTINFLIENKSQNNPNSDLILPDRVIIALTDLQKSQKDKVLTDLKNFLIDYYNESFNKGFINISSEKLSKNEITIQIKNNQRMILQSTGITDKTKFIEKAEELIPKKLPAIIHPLALEIVNKLNIPNLIFSKDLTDKTIELAMQSVSKTFGIVREGEIIIKNSETLTKENISKIRSYQSSRYMTSDSTLGFMFYLGSFGHAAIVMSLLIVYLIVLRRKIFDDNVKLVIMMLILISTAFLSWFSTQINSEFPMEYLIFIPSFSMLVAIVFDSRTAFVANVTMALLLAGIRGNDYITGTTMIFTGMISAYTVRDIQNRTQMYQSIFFIFLSFSLCILIFGAERSLEGVKFFQSFLMAFISSIISPLITFGLLFIIERTTNIATDLRIKEFDNLDHPLLRKLSESSPGTYQHTISVAVLAERCAREIEANHLLTKVGAYFHDIGKLVKPEYFTENQIGLENKHDLISARKSAKLIIDHVQEGIDLAIQYKIPQRIIDFIPMHHGTSLVKHFYAKALEDSDGKEINSNDFRYPGPKPKTKETAILMICDSAEAISRLDALSFETIENIIDSNIKDRISDGQFDECNITLDELNRIKQIIAKNLIGMTHKRVIYKEIPKIKK